MTVLVSLPHERRHIIFEPPLKSKETTGRHKSSVHAKASSSSLGIFFKRKEPTNVVCELATKDGGFAYHETNHNQSFCSMDYTGLTIRKFHQRKYTCARTKCKAIAKNIFALWALKLLAQVLINIEAIALSIDTLIMDISSYCWCLSRFYNNARGEIATRLIDFIEVKVKPPIQCL